MSLRPFTRARWRALAAGLALAAVAGGAAEAANRALVIGISRYQHLEERSQLRAAAADATRFRDFLISSGRHRPEEIRMLLNGDATANAVRKAFVDLLVRQTAPGDRVTIYYSGHGSRVPDKNGDETVDHMDEAIVLADAGGPDGGGRLIDDEMEEMMAMLPGREVLVVLDSCHSGTFSRGAEGEEEFDPDTRIRSVQLGARGAAREMPRVGAAAIEPPMARGSDLVSVWSSSSPDQSSWEEPRGGVFTRLLIKGLGEKAADLNRNGAITEAELLAYTRRESAAWCERSLGCRKAGRGLTPVFEGRGEKIASPVSPVVDSGPGAYTPIGGGGAASQPPSAPPAPAPVAVSADPGDLLPGGNEAGLSLGIEGGPFIRLGGRVQLRLSSNARGKLVVLDANPAGELFQLFPSPLSQDGVSVIAAGAEVLVPEPLSRNGVPMQMHATEPTGRGALYAVLIEDPSVDIDALIGGDAMPAPIPNARQYLWQLSEKLRRLQIGADGGSAAVRWSVQRLAYEIAR